MKKSNKSIIVVSGLPRSGTSMMMQMLEAGGVEILTDDVRKPDRSNPKGYFEYEPVKKLHKNHKWMYKAEGKAVKIVCHLLVYLPDGFQYKVIFMRDEIKKIIQSQQRMLKLDEGKIPDFLSDVFKKHISDAKGFIRACSNIEAIDVFYKDVLENTDEEVERISSFLNQDLKKKEMTEVVDPSLDRI